MSASRRFPDPGIWQRLPNGTFLRFGENSVAPHDLAAGLDAKGRGSAKVRAVHCAIEHLPQDGENAIRARRRASLELCFDDVENVASGDASRFASTDLRVHLVQQDHLVIPPEALPRLGMEPDALGPKLLHRGAGKSRLLGLDGIGAPPAAITPSCASAFFRASSVVSAGAAELETLLLTVALSGVEERPSFDAGRRNTERQSGNLRVEEVGSGFHRHRLNETARQLLLRQVKPTDVFGLG